jgi:hypothetical protein
MVVRMVVKNRRRDLPLCRSPVLVQLSLVVTLSRRRYVLERRPDGAGCRYTNRRRDEAESLGVS